MRPKLIYFAERHPSLSAESFTNRWRRHGELGMSLPRWRNVLRYTQAVVKARAGGGPPGAIACDGVATVVYRSEEARIAHSRDPDSAVTKADEALCFARPVRETAVLTIEQPLLPHLHPARKLYVRAWPAGGVALEAFQRWWANTVNPVLTDRLRNLDQQAGVSRNLARSDSAALGCGVTAAVIDEISTSDPTASAAELIPWLASVAEAGRHLGHFDWIAVEETVLHDVSPGAAD